jgi:hypothetical protein
MSLRSASHEPEDSQRRARGGVSTRMDEAVRDGIRSFRWRAVRGARGCFAIRLERSFWAEGRGGRDAGVSRGRRPLARPLKQQMDWAIWAYTRPVSYLPRARAADRLTR